MTQLEELRALGNSLKKKKTMISHISCTTGGQHHKKLQHAVSVHYRTHESCTPTAIVTTAHAHQLEEADSAWLLLLLIAILSADRDKHTQRCVTDTCNEPHWHCTALQGQYHLWCITDTNEPHWHCTTLQGQYHLWCITVPRGEP